MKIDVLTLFPEMFRPVTEESILGRAAEKGILDIRLTDIRDFSNDKHNKADDYPFGGGGGMVMMADPIFGALEHVDAKAKKIIYMSPRGKILDEEKIRELAEMDSFVILCGHYEGVDQRVLDYWDVEEISIGDYVLTNHQKIALWKLEKSLELTKERRPDLYTEFISHRNDRNEDGTKKYGKAERQVIDRVEAGPKDGAGQDDEPGKD